MLIVDCLWYPSRCSTVKRSFLPPKIESVPTLLFGIVIMRVQHCVILPRYARSNCCSPCSEAATTYSLNSNRPISSWLSNFWGGFSVAATCPIWLKDACVTRANCAGYCTAACLESAISSPSPRVDLICLHIDPPLPRRAPGHGSYSQGVSSSLTASGSEMPSSTTTGRSPCSPTI